MRRLERKIRKLERGNEEKYDWKKEGVKHQATFNNEMQDWLAEKLRTSLEDHFNGRIPADLEETIKSVFRLKYARISERGREKFVRTYLRSIEGSTLKSYQSGYKALGRICLDREISIFRLLEEERCVIMMEAAKRGLS